MISKEFLPEVGYVNEDGDVLPFADYAAATQDPELITDTWDGGHQASRVIAERIQQELTIEPEPLPEPVRRPEAKKAAFDYPTYDAGIETQLAEHGPHPSVSFKDAAIALDAVMSYFNRRNRTAGARQQVQYADSDFVRRYTNPVEVIEGMSTKTQIAVARNQRALDTLADASTLRRAGTEESSVRKLRAELLEDLDRRYGGPGLSDARKKLVRRVNKLANPKPKKRS